MQEHHASTKKKVEDLHVGFLVLLRWKLVVKMKMVLYLSFDIKVWDTLFYLPRESDVGASYMGKLNY